MRTPPEAVVGVVETWHAEQGWGVLRTPDGLSVFCHFSSLELPGYRELSVGDEVLFDYTVPGQDGCDASVLTGARPLAGTPSSGAGTPLSAPASEASGAYGSHLEITPDGEWAGPGSSSRPSACPVTGVEP